MMQRAGDMVVHVHDVGANKPNRSMVLVRDRTRPVSTRTGSARMAAHRHWGAKSMYMNRGSQELNWVACCVCAYVYMQVCMRRRNTCCNCACRVMLALTALP